MSLKKIIDRFAGGVLLYLAMLPSMTAGYFLSGKLATFPLQPTAFYSNIFFFYTIRLIVLCGGLLLLYKTYKSYGNGPLVIRKPDDNLRFQGSKPINVVSAKFLINIMISYFLIGAGLFGVLIFIASMLSKGLSVR